MIEKGIKTLIFDFGGVLINLNRQRCINSFKALGVDNIDELIGPFSQQGMFMQLEKGIITPAEFRNEIRQTTGRNNLYDDQIDSAWNSFLEDIPSVKLNTILRLREIYKIFLLSNTNKIHWDWSQENAFNYQGLDVNDYFDHIFLSYEMNMVKPDEEIFKAVMDKTGIDPEETFFIDDSPVNCASAASLGWLTYNAQPGEDWTNLFNT